MVWSWFGSKTDSGLTPKTDAEELELRLAVMDGKILAAHVIALSALRAAPKTAQDHTSQILKQNIANELGKIAPKVIPHHAHQAFRDELSRTLQIYLDILDDKTDKSPISN